MKAEKKHYTKSKLTSLYVILLAKQQQQQQKQCLEESDFVYVGNTMQYID